jgi:hypothetical protein
MQNLSLLSAFSFDSKGAKEKAIKKKTLKWDFARSRATAVSSAALDKPL